MTGRGDGHRGPLARSEVRPFRSALGSVRPAVNLGSRCHRTEPSIPGMGWTSEVLALGNGYILVVGHFRGHFRSRSSEPHPKIEALNPLPFPKSCGQRDPSGPTVQRQPKYMWVGSVPDAARLLYKVKIHRISTAGREVWYQIQLCVYFFYKFSRGWGSGKLLRLRLEGHREAETETLLTELPPTLPTLRPPR